MNQSKVSGISPIGPLRKICPTPFSSIHHRRLRTQKPLRSVKKRRSKRISRVNATLQDIVKKTWLVYSCSPLHQFKNDETSLERYSRLLSAVFSAHTNKNMWFSTCEEEIAAKATFSLAEGIALNTAEPEAVKLSITTKEGKLISEIYFCSVEADILMENVCDIAGLSVPGMEGSISEQFTVFPIILCRGNVTPRNVAFEWMKTEFDCNVSKMQFNTISLSWMLGLWGVLQLGNGKRKSTRLIWRIPVPDLGLDTIESEFDPESVEMLWKAAHDSSLDCVDSNEIENFLGGIQEHLTNHFKIKFQSLPLQELDLETVHVHKDGKIKVMCEKQVHTILSHLTQIAINKLDWKNSEE